MKNTKKFLPKIVVLREGSTAPSFFFGTLQILGGYFTKNGK